MRTIAIWVAAALVIVGAMVAYGIHRGTQASAPSLLSLRPEEVDIILLKGMCLSKVEKPGDPPDRALAQVIDDPVEIANFIGTIQRTKHLWRRHEDNFDAGRADEIEIRLKKDPTNGAFRISVDGDNVGRDYGPEMKKLYEKYRQRTWAQIEGR